MGDERRSMVMKDIHEGMRVVDVAGTDMGTISTVKLPSDGQATPEGSEMRPRGMVARLFSSGPAGPDLPEALRDRLMLSGYIEVDGPGLIDADRYVPADQIAGVSDDVVRLSVRHDATLEAR